MIDPDELNAFLAVYETRHFVQAADRLGTTQSVVSKRLARIEDRLGARLMVRGRRSAVVPTRAGELFADEARLALAAILRAKRVGRNVARGATGPLNSGYVFTAAMTGLVSAVARAVGEALPEVRQEPRLMETPAQLAALADGRIDFGIVRPRPSYPAGLAVRTVHREPLVLAMAITHPLAAEPSVRAGDIVGQRYIVPQFHEQVGLIDEIRFLAGACRAPMPAVDATGDFVTALSLAAAGIGVVLAPRSLERLAIDGVTCRPIADHRRTLDLVLCHRPDAPPAAMAAVLAALPECAPARSTG